MYPPANPTFAYVKWGLIGVGMGFTIWTFCRNIG